MHKIEKFPQIDGELGWLETVPEGVFVMGGRNGVGVVKGTYLEYYTADYLSGGKSDNLDFVLQNAKPSWIPPDPFRGIGAKMRLNKETRCAKGEV